MIKVFKLINGEELISEVKKNSDGTYTLESPASIMMQQTERGMGVGVAPYMPYAVGDITLNNTAVASIADADPKMENEYRRVFGSGIEIVPANAIK
jgi:hypothetical protein